MILLLMMGQLYTVKGEDSVSEEKDTLREEEQDKDEYEKICYNIKVKFEKRG